MPIWLAILREETKSRIAVDSFILLIASFAIRSHVLSFFRISLPVVQVGGGLIVIATGWAMLKQREDNRSADFMERIQQVAQFLAAPCRHHGSALNENLNLRDKR
jgi:small neutral amino acid transporter SnatA (MarC family)